jgi:hypothetical chaperone protein
MITSAIDFGTSNSVAGIVKNGNLSMVELGENRLETKTVLFYSFEDKSFYVGDSAIKELKDCTEGRYLQSLKSFLGSKEEIETTLGTNSYTLEDLIAIILKEFKNKMEKTADSLIENVVLGRPVKFSEDSQELDLLAQKRLENSAKKAGFKEVLFQYEPIAAALSYEEKVVKEELILVADIGGGTTDYSIVKIGGKNKNKSDRKEDILANYGIYIGGNNFDAQIIKNFIAPNLGKGTIYKCMGKDLEVGGGLYYDLSQWHLFQRMFNKQVLHQIEKLIAMSYEKDKIKRLQELIVNNLYFDFAQKIINSKIQLSTNDFTTINMNIFTNPFSVNLTKSEFETAINQHSLEIEESLLETLKLAKVSAKDIDKVFLTGGSTLVPAIKQIYSKHFSKEKIVHTDVFTSVGYGLALYAKKLDK